MTDGNCPIKKVDDEKQVVLAEVYAPGYPDSQGDFMTEQAIWDAMVKFVTSGRLSNIDLDHDGQPTGCQIVEFFQARGGDPDFIPGSWVIGVWIPDPTLWAMVKSGELNGFSIFGQGMRRLTVLDMEIPEFLTGETDTSMGHAHTFTVQYGDEGEFLGGKTDTAPDGHFHLIRRGTVTEPANGHTHRFSYVEGLLDAQGSG